MTAALCRGGACAVRVCTVLRSGCFASWQSDRWRGGAEHTRRLAWRAAAAAGAPPLRVAFRAVHATPLCAAAASDGPLPATFVAPTKVDLSEYPPPTRQLTKGALQRPRQAGDRSVAHATSHSLLPSARRRRGRAFCAQRRRGRPEREQRRARAALATSVTPADAAGRGAPPAGRGAPPAVNTKADIRFDVLGASFLPDWVKENLMEQARAPVHARFNSVCCLSRARYRKRTG